MHALDHRVADSIKIEASLEIGQVRESVANRVLLLVSAESSE